MSDPHEKGLNNRDYEMWRRERYRYEVCANCGNEYNVPKDWDADPYICPHCIFLGNRRS